MAAYAFEGTTTSGLPVRVEVGYAVSSQAYRMAITCPDPELVGDWDPNLFCTDALPAGLQRPDPAHLQSILDGFGIVIPPFIRQMWGKPQQAQQAARKAVIA